MESNYAYYALHKFHILPSEFVSMEPQEKAFVMASIDVKIESDKKKAKEAERKSKRNR